MKDEDDIVYGSADPVVSRRIGKAVRRGQLRKIAPRLYSSDLKSNPADIVRRHWKAIVAHAFPNAVIGYRSVEKLEDGPPKILWVSGAYRGRVQLPGIEIRCERGPGPQPGDVRITPGLYCASPVRAMLENLAPSKDRGYGAKARGWLWVRSQMLEIFYEQGWRGLRALDRRIARRARGMDAQALLDRYRSLVRVLHRQVRERYGDIDPSAENVQVMPAGEMEALKRAQQERDYAAIRSGSKSVLEMSLFWGLGPDDIRKAPRPQEKRRRGSKSK